MFHGRKEIHKKKTSWTTWNVFAQKEFPFLYTVCWYIIYVISTSTYIPSIHNTDITHVIYKNNVGDSKKFMTADNTTSYCRFSVELIYRIKKTKYKMKVSFFRLILYWMGWWWLLGVGFTVKCGKVNIHWNTSYSKRTFIYMSAFLRLQLMRIHYEQFVVLVLMCSLI